MRTINEQLADIMSGKRTVAEIIAEGVHSYAIEYYSPSSSDEYAALSELRTAYKAAKTANPSPKKTDASQPVMLKCSCGHTIAKHLVMSASMGTSCPDCYDRMSD